ncbi:hypothetical protein AZF05_06815 [Corynebacterium diphtheriae bv. intermedius]|nr:hypothetical protein W5M_03811 [Corynebacterium diphtheriae bv. intermedius str. NCTC 5011]OWM39810.1 hypothetical protein AZF05_06815 [Corynebacterium diphtheriae bv. intermedius]
MQETTPAPAAGVAERGRQLEMRMFLDVDRKNLMAAERSRWQQSPKIGERGNRKSSLITTSEKRKRKYAITCVLWALYGPAGGQEASLIE